LVDHDRELLFRQWLRDHGGTVLKVARAYTLTHEDCQDLSQQILLEVWRSLPTFQGNASAATWSYRVALNTALGWHRKERRRRGRQQPLVEVEDLASAGLNSGSWVVKHETVQRLYEAIRQLPKGDAALVLLYLDELSYREMAEVLGISESNVGVKLSRAKKALMQWMKGESDERR
jgi:RNA polymerase sigma-70 factor, ECF subfamily